jgi:hypothetical protein
MKMPCPGRNTPDLFVLILIREESAETVNEVYFME